MYIIISTCIMACTCLLWLGISLIGSLIAIPLTYLPEFIRYRNRCYFFVMSLTSRCIIKSAFFTIHYTNKASLDAALNVPSIIIANHSSALDIPLIDGLMKSEPRLWISNEKYEKIPLLGSLLRRMNISLNPIKPKEAIRALERAEERAGQTNQHIIIFPEGTRYDDGDIHPFKQGFAHLAEHLDRPIIPILLENMHTLFPRSAKIIYRPIAPISVFIGPPMRPLHGENRKDFIDRIERWFKLNKRT